MNPLLVIAIAVGVILNIAMIISFFKLCSDVNKLTQKFCPDESQKPAQDLDEIAATLPELQPGDHVMNDDVEMVVSDRNGNFYKCYHVYNMKAVQVLHRAVLKPVPNK